jgi:hypothetical protein
MWWRVGEWILFALIPFCVALAVIERVKREWLNGWPTYLTWAVIALLVLGLVAERFAYRSAKPS